MTRKIDFHKVEGKGDGYDGNDVLVLDEKGAGGACHRYSIHNANDTSLSFSHMDFQNGPIQEAGPNGVTQEDLLAIVIDRLRGFQSGPFANRENALALTHCEEALMWLHKRTRDRLVRGVEGFNKA